MVNLECGQCGNPIGSVAEVCPKCGGRGAVRQDRKKYLEVDVAHAAETVEKALVWQRQELEAERIELTAEAERLAKEFDTKINSEGDD